MLYRKLACCVAIAVLGSGINLLAQDQFEQPPRQTMKRQTVRSQNPWSPDAQTNSNVQWKSPNQARRYSLFAQSVFPAQSKTAAALNEALTSMKNAESEEMKANAKMNLRDALAADYDDKMDRYDEHIEKLENQLEEMRARLSRRREAKDDMVDLKLKGLVADADGLGWPTGPTNDFNFQRNWAPANRFGNAREMPAQRVPTPTLETDSPTPGFRVPQD